MKEFPQLVHHGLAVQARTAGSSDHPEPNLLAAFTEQRLTRSERAGVLEHLAVCAACRGVLALALPERDAAVSAPAAKPFRLAWPVLRWGAAAAALALLLVAVGTHEPRRAANVITVKVAPEAVQPTQTATSSVPAGESAIARPTSPREPESGRMAAASPATRLKRETPPVLAKKAVPDQPGAAVQASAGTVERQETAWDAGQAAVNVAIAPEAVQTALPPVAPSAEARGRSFPGPSLLAIRSAATPNAIEYRPNTLGQAEAPSELLSSDAGAQPGDQSNVRRALGAVRRHLVTGPVPRSGPLGAIPGSAGTTSVATTGWSSSFTVSRRQTSALTGTAWNITQSGHLLRSLDGGRSWQAMLADVTSKFRVMCTASASVWVAAQDGFLFRSDDNGDHWTRLAPPWNAASAATILRIDFADARQGRVLTSSGEVWQTSDGGNSWVKLGD